MWVLERVNVLGFKTTSGFWDLRRGILECDHFPGLALSALVFTQRGMQTL